VAYDNTASQSRNRLTKPPEANGARDLLETEYGLRSGARGGGAGSADAGIWEQMWSALRRILDRVRGRSRSAQAGDSGGSLSDGGPAGGPAGGQEPGPPGQAAPLSTADGWTQAPSAEPQWMSPSERSAHERVASLVETVGRLPKLEREAFEDEVLHLVRNDEKWRKAFEESPESMPTVARYAVNAHLREALREVPPEAVPQRGEPPHQGLRAEPTPVPVPAPVPSFQNPQENEPIDSQAAETHQQQARQRLESNDSPNPPGSEAHVSNAPIAAQAGAHLRGRPVPSDQARAHLLDEPLPSDLGLPPPMSPSRSRRTPPPPPPRRRTTPPSRQR
jgi:hypothetical protein